MPNFSATFANTRIFPTRDYDEHDVINFFSKDVSGVAGELVKIIRSTPSSTNGYSQQTVGASFNRTYNKIYETTDKVKATAGGQYSDTKYNVLGLTLNATLVYDENGMPLQYNQQRREELQCLISGETVPVLRRGLIGIYSNGYTGTPTPGYAVVPYTGGNGLLHFIDPTNTGQLSTIGQSSLYRENQVIGYCLSNSGNEFDGYALISLEL
jgi:hypothetical protein